jgi:hypothetical protein
MTSNSKNLKNLFIIQKLLKDKYTTNESIGFGCYQNKSLLTENGRRLFLVFKSIKPLLALA